MEIFQSYDFTGRDCKIWEIYQVYQKFCNQRRYFRKFLPIKTDPRENKNWIYFETVYERYKKNTVFDPYIFIEAQFRNLAKDKMIFPAQLKTNIAADKYAEHRDALKLKEMHTISNTEKIMTNLANTLKFLQSWWKKKKLIRDDYSSLFRKAQGEMISEGMSFCMQGMISKYFMAVSKHFNREYEKLDSDWKYEIVEPEKLKSFRIKLRLNEYAYNFAKEIFEEEIL